MTWRCRRSPSSARRGWRSRCTALGARFATGPARPRLSARDNRNGVCAPPRRQGRATDARGDLFDKRRRLMDDWAVFCSRPMPAADGNVVAIRRGAHDAAPTSITARAAVAAYRRETMLARSSRDDVVLEASRGRSVRESVRRPDATKARAARVDFDVLQAADLALSAPDIATISAARADQYREPLRPRGD